jgi:hypothetical protein
MVKAQRAYLDEMANPKNRQRLTAFEQRCVRVCLARLDAAEKVVEAARARLEVWDRETYAGVVDSLAAYDAIKDQDEA